MFTVTGIQSSFEESRILGKCNDTGILGEFCDTGAPGNVDESSI